MSLQFGDFELDRERRQLLRSGQPVPLEPKAYELLSLLVERRPRALSRAQIRDVVWPGVFVSESTLGVAVNAIRQALGDDARQPRFIRTVHGFGYAFCGEVAGEAALEGEDAAARRVEPRGPYPGLSSFTEEDAEVFFGREAEVEALWERLQRQRLLALIGPSGAGKTSFLQAGLLPSRPEGWGGVLCQPGNAPLVALSRALVPELSGDMDALRELVHLEEPEAALSVLGRWRRRHGEALLIVDQFEELFTLNPPEAQERFGELLGRLASEADVHVLLSMRDDFLFRCHDHDALEPVFSELTPLGPPTGATLRRALVHPALTHGFRFEDDALVEEMLSEVVEERGALPLLAFAVSRLWEKRDHDRKLLTREAYEEIGGVVGALAQHAEATMDRIGSKHQGLVREIFRNLVTAQGTRAAIDREELLSAFPERRVAEEVLARLIDARLLTSYEVEGQEDEASHHRIEVVHESLLTAWPRLVRWQAQDEEGAVLRDQLKQAAHLWEERGRTDDLLWTGTAFQEYQLWRGRYPGALTALEEDFAAAMAERAARQKRRRRLVAGFVVAAAVVVATITGALWRRSEAAGERARVEALRAEAGELLALAKVSLEDDSTAALAYARGSLDLHDTPVARRFVLEILWRGPAARILDLSEAARALGLPAVPERFGSPAFSPDGRWFAGRGGYSEPVLLFDRDGGPTRTLSVPSDASLGVLGFGPRSDQLVTNGMGRSLRFWSLPDLREVRTVNLGPGDVDVWGLVRGGRIVLHTRTIAADGRRFGDKFVEVMDFADEGPRVVATVPRDLYPYGGVDSEATHATAFSGRQVTLLCLDGTNRLQPLAELPADIAGADVSLQGDLVVVSDESGQARVWSRSGGAWRLLRTLQGPAYTGATVTLFDQQGRRFSQAGPNGSHVLWDLEEFPDARPVVLVRPGPVGYRHETFDPSGQWLATGDHARTTIEFWPVASRWRRVLPGLANAGSLAFSPDSRWLTTCPAYLPVRQWPLKASDGAVGTLTPGEGEGCHSVALHPEGREVLVGTGSDTISPRALLYSVAGGAPRQLVESWEGAWFFLVAFDPRGRRAVAVPGSILERETPESRALMVWDLETGEKRVHSVSHLTDASWRFWVPAFAPDGRLYVGGQGGVQRLTLPPDAGGTVSSETIHAAGFAVPSLSGDGRQLLVVGAKAGGMNDPFEDLLLFDLVPGASRPITTHGTRLSKASLSPSGRLIVTGDRDGIVRVGPVSGEEPHLLLGHTGPVKGLAISPDERWIASSTEESISIWPTPDLTQPPLHTLPHDELLAKLDALTNLRVVRDPSSPTGWSEEIGPFPGWKDVPTW